MHVCTLTQNTCLSTHHASCTWTALFCTSVTVSIHDVKRLISSSIALGKRGVWPVRYVWLFLFAHIFLCKLKQHTYFNLALNNKAVLEPRDSPAFASTYFCNHCNIRFENTSMWIHWSFFPKTWTKGHWSLHDLWPHVCWGHMCDSTQGSLCPSPMTIHLCMWIQWSILQITTYIHILHTYILHTTYRMSDHIVSYWTQFRRDKKESYVTSTLKVGSSLRSLCEYWS